ncbi:MAG: 50S ribosomal protein L6 [bacterium]
MSKIGQKALIVPQTVTFTVEGNVVTVKGKLGVLTVVLPQGITIEKGPENTYLVMRRSDSKELKSLHGTFRTLIDNAIIGVEKAWEKRLEVVGTGFNVKMQGKDLVFKVGYSHPVIYKETEGVTFAVDGANKVIISGRDKQRVGEIAYKVKMLKKPDAYKGKGIKYEGEKLRIKPGKKAAKTA